jgi:autotransporter-associated beta strand protein
MQITSNYSTVTSLPGFTVSNDFQIIGGTFIRVAGGNGAASGNGTTTGPYQIVDIYGLQGIESAPSFSYLLNTAINAAASANWNAGNGFNPLGSSSQPFAGNFNGNNLTISGLYINNTAGSFEGLFGVVGSGGVVSNIGVTAATVNANSSTGDAGIIAGEVLAGGSLTNDYSTGSVSAAYAGGLVGVNASTLSNVYSQATVTGITAGGLVGSDNGGSIIDAYTLNAKVSGSNSTASTEGGLVGLMTGGTLSASFSDDAVASGTASGNTVGGLVGEASGVTITNTYSLGVLSLGATDTAGGLVGNLVGGSISDSYSTGYLSGAGVSGVGGLVGMSTGTVSNSYWNETTSGQTTSAGGTGETTAAMMQQTTFCSSGTCSGGTTGFDFTSGTGAWGIINGSSYPYLTAIYSGTPEVISGTVSGTTANSEVTLAVGGVALAGTTSTGANQTLATISSNGFYYFVEGSGVIGNNTALITYLTGGSAVGSAITETPASATNITNLNITVNSVSVGSANSVSLSNSFLLASSTSGSLSNAAILYSGTASNIVLNSTVGFITEPNTTYTIGGSISGPASAATGALDFQGPVVLGASLNLNAGSNPISFGNTVNGAFALTLTGSAVNFNGAVGGQTALTSLTVTGATLLGSSVVITSGNQTYNSATLLGVSNTLTSSGLIKFANTVDDSGTTAGAQSLTLNANGEFDQAVGGNLALGGLAVSGTAVVAGNVTTVADATTSTTGNQSYTGALTLSAVTNSTLHFTGNSLSFSTINGVASTTQNLSINTSGSSSISGVIGNDVGNLVLNANSFTGSLLLSAANTYTGSTTVDAGSLSVGSSSVLSNSVLTSGPISIGSLLLNGGELLANSSGLTLANTFTVSAVSTIGGSNSLTLTAAGTLNSTLDISNTAGTVELSGALQGAAGLSKSGAGAFVLAGGSTNNYSGTTAISGGTLQLAAANSIPQTSAVSLSSSGVLDLDGLNDSVGSLAGTGGTVITSTVLSTNPNLTIDNNNSSTTYAGVIEDAINLIKVGTGVTEFSGSNSYSGTTTISGGTLKVSNANGLGTSTVTVNSSAQLELNAVNINGNTLNLNNGIVVGTGTASYTGSITLGNNSADTLTTLFSGDSFTVSGSINGTTGSGNNGALTVTPVSGSTIYLDSVIGNNTPIASLTLSGAGTVALGSNISTVASQVYNTPIILGNNLTFAAGNASNLSSTITFNSTIDGAYNLVLESTGGVTLNGQVGSNTALSSLTLEALSTATPTDTLNITISSLTNSNSINTSGLQTYDDALQLSSSTALDASALLFQGSVTGSSTPSLTLVTQSGTTFNGNVSFAGNLTVGNGGAQFNVNQLSLASINANPSGQNLVINVNGSNNSISGAIASSINSLTLNSSTGYTGTLTLSSSASTYSGGTNLDAGVLKLTASSNSNPLTAGPIGTGSLNFNGGTLSSSGGAVSVANSYVVAASTTAIISGANNIALNGSGTLNASSVLSITNTGTTTLGTVLANSADEGMINGGSSAGPIIFGGAVGTAITPINSIDLSGTATTAINGTTINTQNNQTYSGAVTLGGSTTAITSSNGSLLFDGTVDEANSALTNLSLSAVNSTVSFDAAVGSNEPLESLTLTAAGTYLNGASVATVNNQSYTSPNGITVGANTTLSSSAGDVLTSNAITSVNNQTTGLPLYALTVANAGLNSSVGPLSVTTFTKAGTGTLTLGNADVINGVTIDQGILEATTSLTALGTGFVDITPNTTSGATLSLVGISITNPLHFVSTSTENAALISQGITLLNTAITVSGANNSLSNTSPTILTISSAITDGGSAGTVIKQGTGTIILTGQNTYSDGTIIMNGILQANVGTGVTNQLPSSAIGSGAVTIDAGTLVVDSVSVANSLTMSGNGFTGQNGALVGTGTAAWTGAISLAADSTIATANAGDSFTLSTINGAYHLSLNGPGTISLSGTVGGSTALSSVTANVAHLTIDTNTINTTKADGANQTYNSAVTLATNVTLTATDSSDTDGKITFSDTISGAYNLTLNSTTGSSLENTIDIGGLTLSATPVTATDTLAANVKTTGSMGQVYNNAVALNSNADLISISGPLYFASSLTGSTQTVTLQNASSATGAVTVVGALSLGGLVTGSGAYNLQLLGGATINSGVTFNNTAGVTLGTNTSNVSQTYSFAGNLISTASTTTLAGGGAVNDIETLQTSNGALQLGTVNLTGEGTTLLSSGSGAISLGIVNTTGLAVDTASLETNSSSGASLNGNINNIYTLTLSGGGIDVINAASITTFANQTYNDRVQVAANTSLDGVAVDFASTITNHGSAVGDLNISARGGSILSGAINIGSLSLSGGNDDSFSGGTITTSGNQTYNDYLTLGSNATLTSTAGTIRLISTGTIDGAGLYALTISNTDSESSLAGTVTGLTGFTKTGSGVLTMTGVDTAIAPITINQGTFVAETTLLGNGVILGAINGGTGYQVGDVVNLVDQNLSFSGTVVTGKVTAVNSGVPTVGDLTVGSGYLSTDTVKIVDETTPSATGATTTITAEGNSPITVNSGATLEIASTPLNAESQPFEVGYPGQSLTLNGNGVNGQGALTSSCTVTGECAYGEAWAGNVTLGSVTVTIGSIDALILSAAGQVNGSGNSLVLTGTGAITLDGTLTNINNFTDNAAGGVVLDNGGFTTSGSQSYNSLLVLLNNTTLTTTTGNISINAGIEGNISENISVEPYSLTLASDSPNTVFTVGGSAASTAEGAFDVENLTISGVANGNDSLEVNTADTQAWVVSQNNGGTVLGFAGVNADGGGTGLSFTNIANLIGGSSAVGFIFEGSAALSGAVVGGTNEATQSKIIDYTSYGTPSVVAHFSTADTGIISTTSGQRINAFSGINSIQVGGNSTIVLPQQPVAVSYSSSAQGFINGVISFTGFSTVVIPQGTIDQITFGGSTQLTESTGATIIDGQFIQFINSNINSFSGSFTPILLPGESAAELQLAATTAQTLEAISENSTDEPFFRNDNLFSVDLPFMDAINANVNQLLLFEQQLDQTYWQTIEKTIKARKVIKQANR